MNPCAVLGIDPGVRGGLALLRADGSIARAQGFCPDMTERELVEEVILSVDLLKAYGSRACFMEKVGQIRGDSAQGAFTFGHIDGLLRGALYASGINPCSVYPQAWQAAMECPTGGQKNISKARAAGLFPGEKITHTIADSLLIAEYGRRRLSL